MVYKSRICLLGDLCRELGLGVRTLLPSNSGNASKAKSGRIDAQMRSASVYLTASAQARLGDLAHCKVCIGHRMRGLIAQRFRAFDCSALFHRRVPCSSHGEAFFFHPLCRTPTLQGGGSNLNTVKRIEHRRLPGPQKLLYVESREYRNTCTDLSMLRVKKRYVFPISSS